jgi:hypothetical protein
MTNLIRLVAIAFIAYDVVYDGLSVDQAARFVVVLLLTQLLAVCAGVGDLLREVVEILEEEDENDWGIYHEPFGVDE